MYEFIMSEAFFPSKLFAIFSCITAGGTKQITGATSSNFKGLDLTIHNRFVKWIGKSVT